MTDPRKPLPLLQSPFTERHGQFSPDGRWLAFTSNEAGRDDVYIQSYPSADTRQLVSTGGGAYPRWGSGGRELLYLAADGRLTAVPIRAAPSSVEFGTPTPLMRLDPIGVHPYPYDVAQDGRILALTPASGAAQALSLTVMVNWQAASTP